MESTNNSLGEFESTLKKHAQELVESLERGRFGEAVQLIHQLNQTRDRGLYQEVGKLTRELHSAIVNFQIDPAMPQAEEVSQITDAAERLSYVVRSPKVRPTAPWTWRRHAPRCSTTLPARPRTFPPTGSVSCAARWRRRNSVSWSSAWTVS